MNPRFVSRSARSPAQHGMVLDDQFFQAHSRRQYRIRPPVEPLREGQLPEFDSEFHSLGAHDASRRRVIVKRMSHDKVGMFGLKYMPIPFLLFADESIQDDDETLGPIFDGIMRDAKAGLTR